MFNYFLFAVPLLIASTPAKIDEAYQLGLIYGEFQCYVLTNYNVQTKLEFTEVLRQYWETKPDVAKAGVTYYRWQKSGQEDLSDAFVEAVLSYTLNNCFDEKTQYLLEN